MKPRRVRLQHLVGRLVHDTNAERVGRIEEVEAEQNADGCHVTVFVLGHAGLLERLSIRGFLRLFAPRRADKIAANAQRVPWQKMDLSNPKRPSLCCTKLELQEAHEGRDRAR